jgi:hypothetical protein
MPRMPAERPISSSMTGLTTLLAVRERYERR